MENKSWWKSKAIQGGVALILIGLLDFFGVKMPTELYALLIGYVGIGLRTAKKPIKPIK